MAVKHIKTLSYDSPSRGLNEVMIGYDDREQEYIVRVFWNGQLWGNGNYETDDLDDAIFVAVGLLAKPGVRSKSKVPLAQRMKEYTASIQAQIKGKKGLS